MGQMKDECGRDPTKAWGEKKGGFDGPFAVPHPNSHAPTHTAQPTGAAPTMHREEKQAALLS